MDIKLEELMELDKEEIIKVLFAIIQKQAEEIAELKAQINQNSNNSSKPPSSDGLAKPAVKSLREKSGKKAGGQKGHKGHGLKIEQEADEEVIVTPLHCPNCARNLSNEPMFHADTRYVYDVEIKIKLIKYDIQETICPGCAATVKGSAPEECKGTVNYGGAIRALCVVLTNYANVGIDKTHKILHDLLGVPMSTGTIKNIMTQFAAKTNDTIDEIKQNLLKSAILHVDETGMRVAGRTQWVHVASNSKYTLVSVHKKRGKEGSEIGGILADYAGTVVHDGWKPYFGFDKCKHAL